MNRLIVFLIVIIGVGCSKEPTKLTSPTGELEVQVSINSGSPEYIVFRNGGVVLENSSLGLVLDGIDLSEEMEFTNVSRISTYTDEYEMLHGKQKLISYVANQQSFTFTHSSGQELTVVFRLSDDGVAFQYFMPGNDSEIHHISEEKTSFNFSETTKAWLQPLAKVKTGYARTNPSYEEDYSINIPVGTPSRDEAGWIYPALFRTGNTWVLISEAGMNGDYAGSHLGQYSPEGEYTIAFPQEGESVPGEALNPESNLPWSSPWRILAIGDLKTIAESSLGTDLAVPSKLEDTSWIKPGRAAWSWAKLKDESVNYDTQKEFIDYAADMGWEYTLVDVNWDQNIGYDGIKELADYAKTKNVGLILWYNSSGDWNDTEYTPKSALLTHEARVKEFSKISELGVKGVKVDFFAGDGQSMMQYYLDIFKDAADNHLLVNTHGTTLPRGWHRTWPNLVTMESVKGFEYVTFFQGNADLQAKKSTMLPFTRNVFSPMDFTPMSPTPIPGIDRVTTPVFEIASPVIFTSGVTHYAETPQGMAQLPEYVVEFIKQIPVDWDESRFIMGEPGKLAVFARRKGTQWFVAGLNGEEKAKEIEINLSFLPDGLNGSLIFDEDLEGTFGRQTINETPNNLTVALQPNGGFVLLLDK